MFIYLIVHRTRPEFQFRRRHRDEWTTITRREDEHQVHCTYLIPTTGLPIPSSVFIFIKSYTGSDVDGFLTIKQTFI